MIRKGFDLLSLSPGDVNSSITVSVRFLWLLESYAALILFPLVHCSGNKLSDFSFDPFLGGYSVEGLVQPKKVQTSVAPHPSAQRVPVLSAKARIQGYSFT